jgi:hypothetical protein
VLRITRLPRRTIVVTPSPYCAPLFRHRFERCRRPTPCFGPMCAFLDARVWSLVSASSRGVRQLSLGLDRTVVGAERRVAGIARAALEIGPAH